MSSPYSSAGPGALPAVPHQMVTTAFTLDGYTIVRNLGLVRGIIVRSRSLVGTIGATLQTVILRCLQTSASRRVNTPST